MDIKDHTSELLYEDSPDLSPLERKMRQKAVFELNNKIQLQGLSPTKTAKLSVIKEEKNPVFMQSQK